MRGKPATISVYAVIARIAEPQGGVVSRRQLLDAGLSSTTIDRVLAAGVLRLVHRGVYALAHRRLERFGLHHAATLAIGNLSAVSYWDAAGGWELRPAPTGPVHVTLPGRGGRDRRPGIILHRAPLEHGDWMLRDGLRITSPARTLLDLAPYLDERGLERALDEAHYRGLVSRARLGETLARNAGRSGVPALRRALAGHELGSTRTESELEETFVRAYREHGGFGFRCQERFPPYRADLFFPTQQMIVEVDGPAHRTKRRRAADAVRDRELADRGFPTIRVTDEEIDADIEVAIARVDQELGRRRPESHTL